MIIDKLIDAIKRTDNPSVVGLDTCLDYLPQDMLEKVKAWKMLQNKFLSLIKI